MDLVALQYDRCFVLEALRRGEIDHLEHVCEAAEADLFRHLIRRDILNGLAERYPSPREKEEVPVWLYLASEISLKLHGAQGYHAFPRVIRSGGLIDALGPELGGRKTTHPETGDVTLCCRGFNHKNAHDRQTPCDQDFLRKFARDTDVERLHAWYNRELRRCLRSLRLFDQEGLFVGDDSYLFVPNNPNYQGSDLLWFDEHNHPVDADQVDPSRHRQHRCYKLVTLIHVNRQRDFIFLVAARVVPGRRHQCPILYELVEKVIRAVGGGVMKILILEPRLPGRRTDGAAQTTAPHRHDHARPRQHGRACRRPRADPAARFPVGALSVGTGRSTRCGQAATDPGRAESQARGGGAEARPADGGGEPRAG